MVEYKEYLESLRIVRLYGKQVSLHYNDVRADMDSVSRFLKLSHDTRIKDLPVMRRTMNVLKSVENLNSPNSTLGDLGNISKSELAEKVNLGKRTMFEIEELCLYCGIEMLP